LSLQGLLEAPTFRPTAEQFADPIAYISSIMTAVEKHGICRIVPPEGWDPPFALEKGTSGTSADSFRFSTRKQFTSHLCLRMPSHPAGEGSGQGQGYDRTRATAVAAAGQQEAAQQQGQQQQGVGEQAQKQGQLPQAGQQQQQQQAGQGGSAAPAAGQPKARQQGRQPQRGKQQQQQQPSEDAEEDEDEDDSSFGFHTSDNEHNLRSFSSYAAWAKALHFSALPIGAKAPPRRAGAAAVPAPRRGGRDRGRKAKPSAASAAMAQLTQDPGLVGIEAMEAEFWRVVEAPEAGQLVETLYGQVRGGGAGGGADGARAAARPAAGGAAPQGGRPRQAATLAAACRPSPGAHAFPACDLQLSPRPPPLFPPAGPGLWPARQRLPAAVLARGAHRRALRARHPPVCSRQAVRGAPLEREQHAQGAQQHAALPGRAAAHHRHHGAQRWRRASQVPRELRGVHPCFPLRAQRAVQCSRGPGLPASCVAGAAARARTPAPC
jgi:hypothetical protein